MNAPRADVSGCGVRSPLRYGKNCKPSPPAAARPEKALQLAGFAAALRESIGASLPPAEQARVDRMIAPARMASPESAATAAWEAGRSMLLEQAIELALSNG